MKNKGESLTQTLRMLRKADVYSRNTCTEWFHDSEENRVAHDVGNDHGFANDNVGVVRTSSVQ